MKRLLTLLLALLAGPVAAAQYLPLVSLPSGFTGQIQPNNALLTPAPTAASSGFNLPHGTAPSSPVNGDCWTTTAGLYCQINGVTVGPYGTGGGGGGLPSIASGHLIGNSTSGTATAGDTVLSALIDRALGSTQGSLLYRNSTAWVPLTPGTNGQCLQTQGAAANPQWASCGGTANQAIRDITFVISGGGSAIATGVAGYLEVPFACTINRVTLIADQTGSIVIDIWKHSYVLNTPPVVADTITASALPTLSSAQTYQDSTLTGWTTAVAAGDLLAFNVNSATTVTQVTLSLKCTAS